MYRLLLIVKVSYGNYIAKYRGRSFIYIYIYIYIDTHTCQLILIRKKEEIVVF